MKSRLEYCPNLENDCCFTTYIYKYVVTTDSRIFFVVQSNTTWINCKSHICKCVYFLLRTEVCKRILYTKVIDPIRIVPNFVVVDVVYSDWIFDKGRHLLLIGSSKLLQESHKRVCTILSLQYKNSTPTSFCTYHITDLTFITTKSALYSAQLLYVSRAHVVLLRLTQFTL